MSYLTSRREAANRRKAVTLTIVLHIALFAAFFAASGEVDWREHLPDFITQQLPAEEAPAVAVLP